MSLELDEEQLVALEFMSDNLHPSLKYLVPVLDSMRNAYSDVIPPHRRALPVNFIILYDKMTILIFSRLVKPPTSSALPLQRKHWTLITKKMTYRMSSNSKLSTCKIPGSFPSILVSVHELYSGRSER